MLISLIWGFAESNFRFLLFRELGVPNGNVVKEIEADGVLSKCLQTCRGRLESSSWTLIPGSLYKSGVMVYQRIL